MFGETERLFPQTCKDSQNTHGAQRGGNPACGLPDGIPAHRLPNPAGQHRAANAEQRGHDDAQALPARIQKFGQNTDDKADNDGADHGWFSSYGVDRWYTYQANGQFFKRKAA